MMIQIVMTHDPRMNYALTIPSSRRRVFPHNAPLMSSHYHHDPENTIDQQGRELQGLLCEKSTTAGALSTQTEDGAQAATASAGWLGQATDEVLTGEDEDQKKRIC
jgi:hypothetical protein